MPDGEQHSLVILAVIINTASDDIDHLTTVSRLKNLSGASQQGQIQLVNTHMEK